MEDIQSRVQTSVNKMLNALDKEHLRNIQAQMYKCSLKCCENDSYGMEDVQRCLDRCSQPTQQAQTYVQGELQNYQDRLQRCALECQDKIRDKVTPSTTEADMMKYRGEMEGCVRKCADTYVDLIPSLMKKMKETLSHQKSS
ncbi:protein FAM136A-like [Lineus longissimus]|uniref:protein FAM136A-like n=1 Tax=Lineus longissimus TaxID=88925 RepID=UPI002B4D5294